MNSEYHITVRVRAENKEMAYQMLNAAIQKRYLKGDWQYSDGIYQPLDFFDNAGVHWKKHK